MEPAAGTDGAVAVDGLNVLLAIDGPFERNMLSSVLEQAGIAFAAVTPAEALLAVEAAELAAVRSIASSSRRAAMPQKPDDCSA